MCTYSRNKYPESTKSVLSPCCGSPEVCRFLCCWLGQVLNNQPCWIMGNTLQNMIYLAWLTWSDVSLQKALNVLYWKRIRIPVSGAVWSLQYIYTSFFVWVRSDHVSCLSDVHGISDKRELCKSTSWKYYNIKVILTLCSGNGNIPLCATDDSHHGENHSNG